MKIGTTEIKAAYLGTRELTNSNAFVGLIPLIEKESGLFEQAIFYCPFNTSLSTTDINNNISPSVDTGVISSIGYSTNGSSQYLMYTNNELVSAVSHNYTLYLEVIPYSVYRNMYIIDIIYGPDKTHSLSLFIYYTKNNKISATINNGIGSAYIDNEITNSPRVVYGNTYKICVRYDLSGPLDFFINGTKTSYYMPNKITPDRFVLGRNYGRNDRHAKADFLTCAVWDKLLTEEECMSMTTSQN